MVHGQEEGHVPGVGDEIIDFWADRCSGLVFGKKWTVSLSVLVYSFVCFEASMPAHLARISSILSFAYRDAISM